MSINFLLMLLAGLAGMALVVALIAAAVVYLLRPARSTPTTSTLSSNRTEGAVSIIAALFVLFSAMLNPVLSAGLAVVFLLALAVYKLLPQR
jgi:hypothetical protein